MISLLNLKSEMGRPSQFSAEDRQKLYELYVNYTDERMRLHRFINAQDRGTYVTVEFRKWYRERFNVEHPADDKRIVKRTNDEVNQRKRAESQATSAESQATSATQPIKRRRIDEMDATSIMEAQTEVEVAMEVCSEDTQTMQETVEEKSMDVHVQFQLLSEADANCKKMREQRTLAEAEYEKKKIEAESARDNLKKATEEAEGQRQSLDTLKGLVEDLRRAKNQNHVSEFERLDKDLHDTTESIASVEEVTKTKNKEMVTLRERVEFLKKLIAEEKTKTNELCQTRDQLQTPNGNKDLNSVLENLHISTEVTVDDEKKQKLKLEELKSQVEQLQQQKSEMESQRSKKLEKMKESKQKLELELNSEASKKTKVKNEELKRRIKSVNGEITKLNGELEAMKKKQFAISSTTISSAELDQHQRDVGQLKGECDRLRDLTSIEDKTIAENIKKIQTARTSRNKFEESVDKLHKGLLKDDKSYMGGHAIRMAARMENRVKNMAKAFDPSVPRYNDTYFNLMWL